MTRLCMRKNWTLKQVRVVRARSARISIFPHYSEYSFESFTKKLWHPRSNTGTTQMRTSQYSHSVIPMIRRTPRRRAERWWGKRWNFWTLFVVCFQYYDVFHNVFMVFFWHSKRLRPIRSIITCLILPRNQHLLRIVVFLVWSLTRFVSFRVMSRPWFGSWLVCVECGFSVRRIALLGSLDRFTGGARSGGGTMIGERLLVDARIKLRKRFGGGDDDADGCVHQTLSRSRCQTKRTDGCKETRRSLTRLWSLHWHTILSLANTHETCSTYQSHATLRHLG